METVLRSNIELANGRDAEWCSPIPNHQVTVGSTTILARPKAYLANPTSTKALFKGPTLHHRFLTKVFDRRSRPCLRLRLPTLTRHRVCSPIPILTSPTFYFSPSQWRLHQPSPTLLALGSSNHHCSQPVLGVPILCRPLDMTSPLGWFGDPKA